MAPKVGPTLPSNPTVFSLLSVDSDLGVKFSHRLFQCHSGPGHGHGPESMHTGMTGQEVATPWHPGLASVLMGHQKWGIIQIVHTLLHA